MKDLNYETKFRKKQEKKAYLMSLHFMAQAIRLAEGVIINGKDLRA